MTVGEGAGNAARTLAGDLTCTSAKDRSTARRFGKGRRWSGGLHIGKSAGGLAFPDEAAPGVCHSSGRGEGPFSTTCGASLAWRSVDGRFAGASLHVPEPATAASAAVEIFIDDKPDDYAFADGSKRMTGAGAAAPFAEGSE